MTAHLTEMEINDLVDGRFSPDFAKRNDAHLAKCLECTDAVNHIAFVVAAAAEMREYAQPGQDLWPAIAAATVGSRQQRGVRSVLAWLVICLVIMAAVSVYVGHLPLRDQGRLSVIALPQPSKSEILTALREISALHSDHQKRAELSSLVRTIYRRDDGLTDKAFFDVANTISSDGERLALMVVLVGQQKSNLKLTQQMIDFTAGIGSTAQKSAALVDIAKTRRIDSNLRQRLMSAASSITTSNEDRARAMRAVNASR